MIMIAHQVITPQAEEEAQTQAQAEAQMLAQAQAAIQAELAPDPDQAQVVTPQALIMMIAA
jgi:predicted ATP-binding protein involved in virulence